MQECVFCKIVRNEIPSHKIWENENFIAILDIFPLAKGMTLVIAKKHQPSYIPELDTQTWEDLKPAVSAVAKVLDTKLTDILKTTFLFEGLDVPHLHAKLIPLYKSDLEAKKPPSKASEEELSALSELLKA